MGGTKVGKEIFTGSAKRVGLPKPVGQPSAADRDVYATPLLG